MAEGPPNVPEAQPEPGPEPEPEPEPEPATTRPRAKGGPARALLTGDWLVAALGAVVLLGLTVVVCSAFGAVLSVVAAAGETIVEADAGTLSRARWGAGGGPYLAFVSFGVSAGMRHFADRDVTAFFATMLPLPLVLVPVGSAWFTMKVTLPLLSEVRWARWAFVAKLALLTGMVAGVAGRLLDTPVTFDTFEDETGLSGSVAHDLTPFLFPALVVFMSGAAYLWRHDLLDLPSGAATVAAGIGDGVGAFLALAGSVGVALGAVAVAVSDTVWDALTVAVLLCAGAVNVGVAGAAVAMGGTVEYSEFFHDADLEEPYSRTLYLDEVSLSNWEFGSIGEGGDAPPVLLLSYLVAPAVAAWFTHRRLERDLPDDDSGVAGVAARVILGFFLAGAALAYLARIQVAGWRDTSDLKGLLVLPPLADGMFLALLWGALGAVIGVVVWVSRGRLR